jgi:hypothetical protein
MAGRRREKRFDLRDAEGVLRVLRDVIVRRGKGGELVAISPEAGLCGELLMIYLVGESDVGTPVRVVSSRPVVVNGHVRHRLQLARVNGNPSSTN